MNAKRYVYCNYYCFVVTIIDSKSVRVTNLFIAKTSPGLGLSKFTYCIF